MLDVSRLASEYFSDSRPYTELLLFLPPATYGYLYLLTGDVLYVALALYLLVGSAMVYLAVVRPEEMEADLSEPAERVSAIVTVPWLFAFPLGPITLAVVAGAEDLGALFLTLVTIGFLLTAVLRDWRPRLNAVFVPERSTDSTADVDGKADAPS